MTDTTRPSSGPHRNGPARRPHPPDIVFVMADDLGWRDLGCYGSPHIRTPVLDRLAADGALFTHGYASAPWCSQTRIALYTGRYPGRLRAGLEEPMRTREEWNGIPHDHPTLASLLAGAGYQTAMFGKWHCGWHPWHHPQRAGFATFFGNLDGAVDYHEHIDTLGHHDLWEGGAPVEQAGYYTDLISSRSADWIADAAGSTPIYVQVNYTAPHWPWEGPGDAAIGAEIAQKAIDKHTFMPLFHLDGGSLAKYTEMVEAMDAGIGQVLDALASTGRAGNTIVVFTSDNGGERWSMNWPFVGEKGVLTEGGVRVPLIVRWPRAVPPGNTSDYPSTTIDWTATLLEAAGAAPHPDYPLDGTSLHAWLTGKAGFPHHDLFWRTSNQGALRRGRHKYVWDGRDRAMLGNWPRRPHPDGSYELLYDVTLDGREAADLAGRDPGTVAQLRAAWTEIATGLLPYPPDHPGLPRHATADHPAVSAAD